MASSKLVGLKIVKNATQDKVTGAKNWAAVRKDDEKGSEVIVEATTAPKNIAEEWKDITWSGDTGKAVPGQLNQRTFSRAASKVLNVKATLGDGTDSLAIWIISASIEIKMKDYRPSHAAPFDAGMRDNTDKLGAVTFLVPLVGTVMDESTGDIVDTMGASGKVAPIATLSPAGISKVVQSGWAFRREVWSRNWSDGVPTKNSNSNWTNDTSSAKYLRLTPDSDDKIYDLDAPDLRWGPHAYESYNNFRQWIEWNGQKCSDYALWYWQARWVADRDPSKQITLNQLAAGNITLPATPKYVAPKGK